MSETIRTDGSGVMDAESRVFTQNDLISRQAAIQEIKDLPDCPNGYSDTYDKARIIEVLEELPSAQTEGDMISRQRAIEEECFVPIHEFDNFETHVSIKKLPVQTPEQFEQEVRNVIEIYEDDVEMGHVSTDIIMEELLTVLGYGDGVELIRKQDRWYA